MGFRIWIIVIPVESILKCHLYSFSFSHNLSVAGKIQLRSSRTQELQIQIFVETEFVRIIHLLFIPDDLRGTRTRQPFSIM